MRSWNFDTIQPDFTIREVCVLFNCGPTKINKLIAEGKLESYKLNEDRRGGRRIKRESVVRFRDGHLGR